jgi:hypothetical protein
VHEDEVSKNLSSKTSSRFLSCGTESTSKNDASARRQMQT